MMAIMMMMKMALNIKEMVDPPEKHNIKKRREKKKRKMMSLIMMEITTMRTKGRNNDCNVIGLFGILVVFGDCISSILLNIS